MTTPKLSLCTFFVCLICTKPFSQVDPTRVDGNSLIQKINSGAKNATIGNVTFNNPVITFGGMESLPIANPVCESCVPGTLPTAPIIGAPGPDVTIACPGTPTFTEPTVSGGCGGVTLQNLGDVTVAGTCINNYSVTRSWDAVDTCGNHSDTVSQTITVVDITPPTIGAPGANATIACTATPIFTAPTASDACGGATINLLSNVTVAGACVGNSAVTRTWYAVDACGNHSATVSQKITLVDVTPPTIGAAGANATIGCTATPIFTPPTASDACGGATINLLSIVTVAGTCANNRTVTRTWDAVDACGNHSATVSQKITITDITPPTIGTAGANATIGCTATPIFTAPTASDACGGVTVNQLADVTAAGTCANNYTVTRTWTAVDACGNRSATVSQKITVIDITPPTIGGAGANATIQSPATPTFTAPTASDLCGPATVHLLGDVTATGTCTNCYTETRTWDAVDACGNHSATVSQAITVINTTGPIIGAAGPNITISCPETPLFTAPTASGGCGEATLNLLSDVTVVGSCANNYAVTRTWDAVDTCGNHSATVSQTITVVDTLPPAISPAGPSVTIECGGTAFFIAPTASDACGGATVNQLFDVTVAGTCANNYTVIRTWDAVDACGNHSATVSQTMIVMDTTPPTIGAAGANGTVESPATPSFTAPTASDLCDSVTVHLLSDVTAAGTCSNCYTETRTWDAVDACGNHSTTVAQTITVLGITQPDTSCVNGTSLFQKIYTGARNDMPYCIAPSSDSDYVIVGYTNSFGSGGTDGLIAKISMKGIVVWSKAIGGSGDDALYVVRKTSDGGFIACGLTKSYGNTAGDAWLVKLDVFGNIQWSRKYGDGNVYGDLASDVTQLSDGGYAVAGTHRAAAGVADGLVIRTDAQGNVIWSKSYANWNSDNASGIVEDGNFLVVTGFYYAASYYDGYVMKLDKSTGTLQWIKGYDAENRSTWMTKIAKTNTGYQVLSVVTDNFVDQNAQQFVWNIAADGSLQNVRKLVVPGTWSESYFGWYPLADGGFISTNGEKNDQSDVTVCRVNANGTLQFSKQYPIAGKQVIASMTSSPDGGYALLGLSTNVPTIADSNNLYVMKIDSIGGSCSGINTSTITVVNPSYSLPTPDVAPIGNVALNNPLITVGVIASLPITNTVCESCVPVTPPNPPPPDTACVTGSSLFQKVYADARNDFGYNIAPATDSGYVIVGFTNSFGNGGTDGLITKINKNGSVVSNKAVGGTGDDLLYTVKRTSDGGFIAVGQTKSYGNVAGDAWLVKLDASANIQWSKKYGDGNVYGDAGYNVTELSDGGYAFAGTHRAAPGVADGLVVRTDSLGNVLWSKSYGNWNSDNASGIVEDGNFLLVAGFYYSATFYDGYVMKLDKSSGVLQWIRGFDAENRSTWMSKIAKTNTGYQVVSPVSDNFADQNQQECIWNINTDGSLQNVRKVVIPGTWSVSWGWYPLADGGFIGANGENNNESDALVCRVNANGSLQFSKQYPVAGKQALLSITSTPEGGYALAGYTTNAATSADSNNVYVMKIDSLGGSCSGTNTNAVTIVNPAYSLPTPDVAPIGNVTINNPVITVGVIESLPMTNTVCETCGPARLTITATGAGLAVGCNPSVQAIDSALGSASATGGCGTPTVSASTGAIQSNGCFHSQTRTFTATDTCGNTATTSRTANWIEDVTPPTIVATGNNLNLGCNPDSSAIDAALGSASAIDSCTTPILSTSTSAIQINGCSRSQTRTFTAIDSCGNTATISRTATWNEVIDFPLPADGSSTVSCPANAVQPTPPIVFDACGNTLTPTVTTPSPVSCNGTMVYTFTYTDCAGHSHVWAYTYTVALPDFTLPADGSSTVECPANAVQPTPPTIVDACGNTLTPIVTTPSPVSCNGTMIYTFTYTDCAGHSHVWTYTYTVALPDFTLPADGSSTVECPANAVQPTPPMLVDACGNALTPTVTVPPAVVCAGTMPYTFTYTDCAGHSHNWTYTYIIADLTPPTITCAGNKTIECNAPVQFDQPTATDNCDSLPTIEVVSTSADGLTRTWRATDACGNTATCSQTITVSACAAHIFPTATTCCNYVTGTAPQLQKVCYSKTGNSISNVTPGVFFYYSYVTAPSSGPFVITVEQFNNNASFRLFAVQNVSQVRLTDLSCGTASIAFTGSITGSNNSQVVLTVSSYTPGATYVVSVKYDGKSITGSTVAGTPTATYTFRSKVNGVIAPGSTGTLNVQFGCQDDTPKPPNNCQLTTVALPTTEQSNSDPSIRAYPNPFTDIVNFQISATVSGKVTLEVYNLEGQKLGIAFEGWMVAGEIRSVQYKSRSASGGLIYQLSTGGKKIAGKVFRLK